MGATTTNRRAMPLTKSFSEQNRGVKVRRSLFPTSMGTENRNTRVDSTHHQRPQWQRSRSNPTATTAAPPRPLPVSAKTKSKLKSFEFEPQPEPDAQGTASRQASPPAPGRSNPAATPAARTAWQDLLTKPEAPTEDENLSPGERILWRSGRDPLHPLAMSPLLPRKGRKRARSSSPLSSPASKLATPAVDVKKLAQGLKTPRADPALELWDRFSVPGVNASPSGLTNPLLAQLLISSSPRPKDGITALGSERPLRKAISCGANWPKRRKADRVDSSMGDASAAKSLPDSKLSMVSALLETVDGEIKKSKPTSPQERPPQRRSPRLQEPARQSPLRRRPGSSPLAKKSTRAKRGESGVGEHKASSDYGDDDFDDETLLGFDTSILVPGDDSTMVVSSEESNQHAPPLRKGGDDDFGDFDDDFFDGAQDLVAEAEAKHASQNPYQGQQQAKPANAWDGDDDVYGDDLDDVDFDAVELAATQTVRPLSSNVCIARKQASTIPDETLKNWIAQPEAQGHPTIPHHEYPRRPIFR